MTKSLFAIILLTLLSCDQQKKAPQLQSINDLAREYVKLGLAIGAYDPDFVDAYYGPDSLKPTSPKLAVFPKDSLLDAVNRLKASLGKYISADKQDTASIRAGWMTSQLTAFGRRIRIFSGEFASFDEESKDLFAVVAPVHTEDHYRAIIARLDTVLPGKGSLQERFQAMANRFVIPVNRIDTVFKAAIAESRKRTNEHFSLPADEHFSLEFVTNKPWSGYNWYKGGFNSLIQINSSLKIFIERAIDVASHESYPGHHVYNMLLEKNLYRDRGWVEVSLYPLFSPQSLIAEGSANYGIELAFPGREKTRFAKDILMPLAGLDTAGLDTYFEALEMKASLNDAGNEAARGLLNHTMDEKEAKRWLMQYGLYNEETADKSISFIRKYRCYVINYNYGKKLVRDYIGRGGSSTTSQDMRWKRFSILLSNELTPADLLHE